MNSAGGMSRPLKIGTEPVRVVMITQHYTIVGTLHVSPHGRLLDLLNKTLGGVPKEGFLAVTDSECYSIADGKLKYRSEFLALQKNHIHFLFPSNEKKAGAGSE